MNKIEKALGDLHKEQEVETKDIYCFSKEQDNFSQKAWLSHLVANRGVRFTILNDQGENEEHTFVDSGMSITKLEDLLKLIDGVNKAGLKKLSRALLIESKHRKW